MGARVLEWKPLQWKSGLFSPRGLSSISLVFMGGRMIKLAGNSGPRAGSWGWPR